MARIQGKDIYLRVDDQIYFGEIPDAALWYDGDDLRIDHTISGVVATEGYHLVIKDQLIDAFLELTDTPPTYSGSEGYNVIVNSEGTGLEFTTVSGADAVFGNEFGYAQNEGPYETTSTVYTPTLSITSGVLPAGTYRISANFMWYHGVSNKPFYVALLVDSVIEKEQIEISSTVSLLFNIPTTLTVYKTFVTSAAHNVALEIASGRSGKTGGIEGVLIEFWRVS